MQQAKSPELRSNLTLWLVLAVCVAPFAGAMLLHRYAPPDSRMNYGELVEVTPLLEVALRTSDGANTSTANLRGKWAIVLVDGAECDKQCVHKLWVVRQLRLTQGKNMDRVSRVWLISNEAPVDSRLTTEYSGTLMLRAPDTLIRALPSKGDPRSYFWLVDPLGNVMMRYDIDADPSRMKKDLNRLLRVSQIG